MLRSPDKNKEPKADYMGMFRKSVFDTVQNILSTEKTGEDKKELPPK